MIEELLLRKDGSKHIPYQPKPLMQELASTEINLDQNFTQIIELHSLKQL